MNGSQKQQLVQRMLDRGTPPINRAERRALDQEHKRLTRRRNRAALRLGAGASSLTSERAA